MVKRVIWKYAVLVEDHFMIEIPEGGEVLSVQIQFGKPVMWAMVDPESPVETQSFTVKGTGHPFDVRKLGRFIGTFQLLDGGFVGHLFKLS